MYKTTSQHLGPFRGVYRWQPNREHEDIGWHIHHIRIFLHTVPPYVPSFHKKLAKNQGLKISVPSICQKCKYTSSNYDLYTRLFSGKPSTPLAQIGFRCGQHMASSEAPLNSISCLQAILNCHALDQRSLQHHISKTSNVHLSLAEAESNGTPWPK